MNSSRGDHVVSHSTEICPGHELHMSSKAYFHTNFQNLILIGASVAPTSEVRTVNMLILRMTENYNVQRCCSSKWHTCIPSSWRSVIYFKAYWLGTDRNTWAHI